MHPKIVFPVVILLGGFLACTSLTFGTPQYAKKEKKSCTVCHASVGKDKTEMMKNLTAAGACYKDHSHSLGECQTAKK